MPSLPINDNKAICISQQCKTINKIVSKYKNDIWIYSYFNYLMNINTNNYTNNEYVIPGNYDKLPVFCLYDIDNNEIPEIILIYDDGNWENVNCDVLSFMNDKIINLGRIKINIFGNIGAPINIDEGLFCDDTYKGHYGALYYYTIENNKLKEKIYSLYDYSASLNIEEHYSLIFMYDNPNEIKVIHNTDKKYKEAKKLIELKSIEFYQISEKNINGSIIAFKKLKK